MKSKILGLNIIFLNLDSDYHSIGNGFFILNKKYNYNHYFHLNDQKWISDNKFPAWEINYTTIPLARSNKFDDANILIFKDFIKNNTKRQWFVIVKHFTQEELDILDILK